MVGGVHSRSGPPLSFALILLAQGQNGTQSAVDTPDDKKQSNDSIDPGGRRANVRDEDLQETVSPDVCCSQMFTG